jgi:hypothetical protein
MQRDVFRGLRIEDVNIFLGADHIWADFKKDRNAKAFGAKWAAFARASVFPTLVKSLEADPSATRKSEFMKRLEAGTASRLAVKPEAMLIPLCKMRLARTE